MTYFTKILSKVFSIKFPDFSDIFFKNTYDWLICTSLDRLAVRRVFQNNLTIFIMWLQRLQLNAVNKKIGQHFMGKYFVCKKDIPL